MARSALDDFLEKQIFGKSGAGLRKQREVDTAEESIRALLSEFPTEIGQTIDPSTTFDPQFDPRFGFEPGLPPQVETVPTTQSREFRSRRLDLGAAEDNLSELLAPAPAPKTTLVRGNRGAQLVESATGKPVGDKVEFEAPFPTGGSRNKDLTPSALLKRQTALQGLRVKVQSGTDIDPTLLALFGDNPSLVQALQGADKKAALAAIDREDAFLETQLPKSLRKKKKDPLGIR